MIEPEITLMLDDLRRMNLRAPGCVNSAVLKLLGKKELTLEQRDRIRAAHRALGLRQVPPSGKEPA